MQIDPIITALAGTIVTMAGFIVRQLTQRAEKAERAAMSWETRYFRLAGMAEIAIEEAEKREQP